MAKTKITKGPWCWGKAKNHIRYVFAFDNMPVLRVVASERPPEEVEANLAMAAAAPQLYNALFFCVSVMISNGLIERSEQLAVAEAQKALKSANPSLD